MTIPLQNMSQGIDCVTETVSPCTSSTAERKFVSAATLPEPETISTLPLCISALCTGLIGIVNGSVVQRPVDDGCARSSGVLENASPMPIAPAATRIDHPQPKGRTNVRMTPPIQEPPRAYGEPPWAWPFTAYFSSSAGISAAAGREDVSEGELSGGYVCLKSLSHKPKRAARRK